MHCSLLLVQKWMSFPYSLGLYSDGAGGHKECEAQFDLRIFPEVDLMMITRRCRWRTMPRLMRLTCFNSLAKVKSLRNSIPFFTPNTKVAVIPIWIVQILT